AKSPQIVLTGDVLAQPNLNAQDDVPVLFDRADGELGIGVAQIEQLAKRIGIGQRGLTDDRDIEQGINPGLSHPYYVLREPGESVSSGGTRIHDGGGTFGNAVRICRYAQGRDAIVNVHMYVD